MAMVLTALSSMFSSALSAATTAGTFLASNAGTIGTALSAAGTVYSGISGYQASKAEAAQLKAKGDNELAKAQREADRRRRETQALLSRANAVAAASGAGATDASVMATKEKIQAEGDTNAMLDMYNGMVNRSDLYREAASRRAEGRSGLFGSILNAGSTVYSDIARRQRESQAGDYGIYGDHYTNGVWS